MMQLHVLDSGSVPVIKSCISKSSMLSGWKEKGLSFYVIKSSLASKTGIYIDVLFFTPDLLSDKLLSKQNKVG